MRKLLFVLILLPFTLSAQTVKFGFFGMNEVMEALPEYTAAQNDYNSLLELCDNEIAHNEAELTRLYVAFLDGQQSFPEPILRKRQKELQEMIDRSVVFRDQLKDYLAEAHDSLFSPIEQKIDAAVERVCLRNNLAYSIDTDKAAYRFINPDFGVNITDLVIQEVISPKPIKLTTAAVVEAQKVAPVAVEESVDAVVEETETADDAESETPVEDESEVVDEAVNAVVDGAVTGEENENETSVEEESIIVVEE